MRFLVGRNVAGLLAAMLLVSGCGGSQSQMAGVSAVPQASISRAQGIAVPLASGPLIYASNGCGGICILSYPDGQPVRTISLSGNIGGDCSDSNGNVFVANDTQVVEYARGDSNPIATYVLAGDEAAACSVDPATANLAVVFRGTGANVAIFPSGSETRPQLDRCFQEQAALISRKG
jgi:hypothetical protein